MLRLRCARSAPLRTAEHVHRVRLTLIPTVLEYRRYVNAVRLTRSERKERTRTDLLAAAKRVFMHRGFHGASLDEIAEEAGYTKGAVYSNFDDKDALFLAVLDEHYVRRIDTYDAMMLADAETLDGAIRRVSRFMAEADVQEPDWLPTLAEFVAHASQHERLRHEYAHTRERFLEAVAGIIDALTTRFGVSLRISTLEAARCSSVMIRGYSAERRIEPGAVTPEVFVEVHAALMRGLIVPRERSDP
jgi:AcrR family transcriptional regulator